MRMKIAMMSAWNTDSGESIYAELLGKALLDMGHQLQVFSFIKDDYHGEGFTGEDEDYVIRCFGTGRTNFLDPRPFLASQYDVFVVQDLGMLPKDNLAKIFNLIKKKANTVHIFYDNKLTGDCSFFQFDWDCVVYFDRRQNFLDEVYSNTEFIPFPCCPFRKGDKIKARKKLDLPIDKKIIYLFCQRGYSLYLPELTGEIKDAVVLIVTHRGSDILEKYSNSRIIFREEEVLSKERFNDYLFASDALILHKFLSKGLAVVSTTVVQALGSGCPILVPENSDFFAPFKDEVLRYSNPRELKESLLEIFKEGQEFKRAQKAAQKFVKKNSPKNIAKEFIRIFESF